MKSLTHTPMVDEGQAAVGGDLPGTAAGASEPGAEEAEASAEVLGLPEEIPRARPAPPSPSAPSDAPREAGASGAAPATTPKRGGAEDEAARRALVAGNRRASIAPPLWKVCARPRPCIRLPPRVARASPLPRPSRLSCTRTSALLRALSGRALFCLFTCLRTSPSQVLRPDQVEGVRWLFKAIADGSGLLGDDASNRRRCIARAVQGAQQLFGACPPRAPRDAREVRLTRRLCRRARAVLRRVVIACLLRCLDRPAVDTGAAFASPSGAPLGYDRCSPIGEILPGPAEPRTPVERERVAKRVARVSVAGRVRTTSRPVPTAPESGWRGVRGGPGLEGRPGVSLRPVV